MDLGFTKYNFNCQITNVIKCIMYFIADNNQKEESEFTWIDELFKEIF